MLSPEQEVFLNKHKFKIIGLTFTYKSGVTCDFYNIRNKCDDINIVEKNKGFLNALNLSIKHDYKNYNIKILKNGIFKVSGIKDYAMIRSITEEILNICDNSEKFDSNNIKLILLTFNPHYLNNDVYLLLPNERNDDDFDNHKLVLKRTASIGNFINVLDVSLDDSNREKLFPTNKGIICTILGKNNISLTSHNISNIIFIYKYLHANVIIPPILLISLYDDHSSFSLFPLEIIKYIVNYLINKN